MSDFEGSPAKDIDVGLNGEDEGLLNRSSSPGLVVTRSEDKTKGVKRKDRKKQHDSSSSVASCTSSESCRSRYRYRQLKNKSDCRRSVERQPTSRASHCNSRNRSPIPKRREEFGDRENPVPNRCIGVFGLSLYTQERVLWEVFGRCGHINEVRVIYDRQTGRSRGFAFIYFRSTDGAYKAKHSCDGMEIDGRKIRVDFSITDGPHPPTPGVYLGRRHCVERRPAPSQRYGPSYSCGYRRSYSPDRLMNIRTLNKRQERMQNRRKKMQRNIG